MTYDLVEGDTDPVLGTEAAAPQCALVSGGATVELLVTPIEPGTPIFAAVTRQVRVSTSHGFVDCGRVKRATADGATPPSTPAPARRAACWRRTTSGWPTTGA